MPLHLQNPDLVHKLIRPHLQSHLHLPPFQFLEYLAI